MLLRITNYCSLYYFSCFSIILITNKCFLFVSHVKNTLVCPRGYYMYLKCSISHHRVGYLECVRVCVCHVCLSLSLTELHTCTCPVLSSIVFGFFHLNVSWERKRQTNVTHTHTHAHILNDQLGDVICCTSSTCSTSSRTYQRVFHVWYEQKTFIGNQNNTETKKGIIGDSQQHTDDDGNNTPWEIFTRSEPVPNVRFQNILIPSVFRL